VSAAAIGVIAAIITVLEIFAITFFVALNGWYLVLLVGAAIEMRQHRLLARGDTRMRILGSPLAPRISVLAAAFNEQATIAESLNSLFGLHYPNVEIVIANDGSRDGTLDVLRNDFGLKRIHTIFRRVLATQRVRGLYRSAAHPDLIVVDKENGGRADALNAALNVATGEFVCVIDADTLIEPDGLRRMVRPFLDSADVLGVGGTIRIANGSTFRDGRIVETRVPRRPIAGIQVVEYLRAFLFGRLGWNRAGGNLIVSGAFGLFRRQAVIDVGGFCHDTIGEDFELVMRLRTNAYEKGGPHRIVFTPDPVAWTEAPESAAILGRQRDRWHRGLTDVVLRYRRVLFNPKYRVMGVLVFPHYAILELLAPVVEAAGMLALVAAALLGILNGPFAVLFFLAAWGFGAALTLFTLLLEQLTFRRYERLSDKLMLVVWTIAEGLGYRQMTVFWRLRGLWKFILGRTTEWGVMERTGFQQQTPAQPGAQAALVSAAARSPATAAAATVPVSRVHAGRLAG
jgi:cellulose synthase/poly-beta-1,6-N-acetylglucosamine synthase-like glycosyltransferase